MSQESQDIYQGYFDYNATTPMCQSAMDAFLSTYADFANPSSQHSLAKKVKAHLREARSKVAELLGCQAENIAFTSGGTEANNWAIKGALLKKIHVHSHAIRPHIVVSRIEHASVLSIVDYLVRVFDFEASYLTPNDVGLIDVDVLEQALQPNTQMVAVMMVNNEVGCIQPIQAMAKLLRKRQIHFHVDGVQAVGKIPVDVHALGMDTMAFAAHKFYGPKGVGGLYIRSGIELEPLLHGGGQEGGLRGGTEAVAMISAMGAAAQAAQAQMPECLARMHQHQQKLVQLLQETIPGVHFHGPQNAEHQVPYTLSVCIPGIRAEALAAILDHVHGIQVSLGSACSQHKAMALSHVLKAMGLHDDTIKSTMRVSMGMHTQAQDLTKFVAAVAQGLALLQGLHKGMDAQHVFA